MWGSIAEWVAAIASAGALIAAVLAVLYSKKAWEIERGRDRRDDIAASRRQAELIAIVPSRTTSRQEIGDGIAYDFTVPSVQIANMSELPIYDIVIENPLPSHGDHDDHSGCEHQGPYYWGIVGPGTREIELNIQDLETSLIDEGRGVTLRDISADDDQAVGEVCDEWQAIGRPAASFTDSAGRRWRRAPDGTLSADHTSPVAKRHKREDRFIEHIE